MRKFIIILLFFIIGGFAGVYTRPSYFLIGQLNWVDVVTKGYSLSVIPKMFTMSMVDESFYHVLKFALGGSGLGLIAILVLGTGGKKSKASKK